MEKGRLTQRRSIISNARVIKAITECGPLLLASVGNSPKLERMDFSPVLSAMIIIALLFNQATAPFFKIITQNLIPFQIAFCCGFPTAIGCLPRLAPRQMQKTQQSFSNWLSCTALHFQIMPRCSSFGHFKDYIHFSVEFLSFEEKIQEN